MVGRDEAEYAALAAQLLGRAIEDAVAARGVARVALSGGSTPSEAYRKLAVLALPFDRVEWYWVDERGVPPDHPRSNYGAAAKDLLLADGKHGKAFRMVGERRFGSARMQGAAEIAPRVRSTTTALGLMVDGNVVRLDPGFGRVGLLRCKSL